MSIKFKGFFKPTLVDEILRKVSNGYNIDNRNKLKCIV